MPDVSKTPKKLGRHSRQMWPPDSTENNVFETVFNVDKACSPTPEQAFLFNIWIACETIQGSVHDQDSDLYNLLEVLNSAIFETWIRSGRRGNGY